MSRWLSLLRQRRQWVRAFSSESSGSSSVSRHAQVLPVWPVGTETRFSQMMYVGEAGKSIDSYKSEDVSDFCEMLLSKPDIFQGLKEWVREGNTFSSSLLSKVYYRLAKRKCYKEILQLLRGIREENMVQTTQTHYIWEMAITCRQQSTYAAEIFYNDIIPARFRSEEVTAALIFSLAKRNALAKSEKWIEQMTVLSTDLLNMLMALYLDRDKHDKVLETYERMCKLGLEPSINTYLMLLTYKDKAGGGLEGIEREAEEAVKNIDLDAALRKTLQETMEVCGYLGKAASVEDIWSRLKSLSGTQACDQSSYLSAMAAFGRVKNVERAEQVFEELLAQDLSKSLANPHAVMVEVYVSNGLMAKAEHVLRHRLNEAVFSPYNSLVRGYIASGDTELALARLKEGVAAIPARHIRPAYKTMMALLPVFAARRDIDGAERIMFHYRFIGDATVYNELLKVYVACNVFPLDFRNRMKGSDVEGDETTEELFEMLDSSPSAVVKEQRRRLYSANCKQKIPW